MGERKYYSCPWVRNCGMEKKNSLHCVESLWPDRALTSPPLIYSTAFLWMQSSQAGVEGCQLYICTVDIIDALYAYLHVISIWFCLFTLLVSETTKGLQIHQRNAQAQMEMGQESPGRQCEERDADAQTCFLLPSSTQNKVQYHFGSPSPVHVGLYTSIAIVVVDIFKNTSLSFGKWAFFVNLSPPFWLGAFQHAGNAALWVSAVASGLRCPEEDLLGSTGEHPRVGAGPESGRAMAVQLSSR